MIPPHMKGRPVLEGTWAHGCCIYRFLFWKESKVKGFERPTEKRMGLCLKLLNCESQFIGNRLLYFFLNTWCDLKDDSDALMCIGGVLSVLLSRLAMGIILEYSQHKETILSKQEALPRSQSSCPHSFQ